MRWWKNDFSYVVNILCNGFELKKIMYWLGKVGWCSCGFDGKLSFDRFCFISLRCSFVLNMRIVWLILIYWVSMNTCVAKFSLWKLICYCECINFFYFHYIRRSLRKTQNSFVKNIVGWHFIDVFRQNLDFCLLIIIFFISFPFHSRWKCQWLG